MNGGQVNVDVYLWSSLQVHVESFLDLPSEPVDIFSKSLDREREPRGESKCLTHPWPSLLPPKIPGGQFRLPARMSHLVHKSTFIGRE